MQHAVRRKDRMTDEQTARELLKRCEYGIMATAGADGLPYAVPLSYVVYDDAVYFHCAHVGHKIENIDANPRVCFTVVGATRPVYAKNFTTYYESAVVFGTVSKIEDAARKTEILMRLAAKYLPEHMDKAPADIAGSLARTAVYKIAIEHITGKAKKPVPENMKERT